jgi:NitT/TauT family transport system substrate-binding protein
MLLAVMAAPILQRGVPRANAQSTTLSCAPAPATTVATPAPASTFEKPAPAAELTKVKVGYVPALIFAPLMVALEKGYFAEFGVDVTLEPFPGGSDPIVLTASGQLDAGLGGAAPAFWNGVSQELPVKIIAPGHMEGNPVATPLMISKEACESGAITSVADLKGKKVSVNARGATEYWLNAALGTGGLTIKDIDLQTLAFPDAVAALASGAVDAAMIGEPLATSAEQQGIAVRLATDFPVQNLQVTTFFANESFLSEHPEAATGLVAAYLKACRDLTGEHFNDPENLAAIQKYTNVDPALISASVKPVYAVDGVVDIPGLNTLQQFFREQGYLEYDENIDATTVVDPQFIQGALELIGSYEAGS